MEETFKTVKSNHLELEVQVVTWFSFAPQRAQAHVFYLMDAASDVRLVPTEVWASFPVGIMGRWEMWVTICVSVSKRFLHLLHPGHKRRCSSWSESSQSRDPVGRALISLGSQRRGGIAHPPWWHQLFRKAGLGQWGGGVALCVRAAGRHGAQFDNSVLSRKSKDLSFLR